MNTPGIDSLAGPQRTSLVERAKNIILQPKKEWAVIDAEPATIGGIYAGYVAILALIPAVCGALGGWLIGHTMFGVTVKESAASAVTGAAVGYILTLIGIYVLAVIIDTLAPNFDAKPNRTQAFKVAAYSCTPAWVAGLLQLVPALALLGALLGIYGLYLFWLGLPKLMKPPAEKAGGYIAVVMICAVVVFIIIGALTTPIVALLGRATPASQVSGSVSVPGVGSVDLDKLNDATKQLEAQANQIQSGAATGASANAVPAETLKGLLPASLGALARTEASSASGGAAGIGGSTATGEYGAGETTVTLTVTDMAAVGALAGIGSALNIQSSRQTETGYEKTETVDGRMTTEEYDNSAKSGKFSVVVANRFMVEANGRGVDMAVLKGAVDAVGIGRLEGLAK